MKTLKQFLIAGSILTLGVAFTSCESDPEFDSTETISVADGNFDYDDDGVWKQNFVSGFLNIDDYEFSHAVPYDNYAYGFTPSRIADKSLHQPLVSFPYASAAGGGITAGSPYLVAYWDSYAEGENPTFDTRSCRIYAEDGDRFQPQSMMVCANTYLYYAVINGTDFSDPFGAGDWVTLTAHGVHEDGMESEAVFYLVNIESDDVASGIVSEWTKFDLSGLGTCTGIYFTMDSSDKNAYGVNVPTYFCMDRLVVKD